MSSTEDSERKKRALEEVRKDGDALQRLSEVLKADKDVVREAMKQKWHAFRHASAELQADKSLVLEAVQCHGCTLGYVCKKLRGNKEVVQAALKHTPYALEYASSKLQSDKELVLDIVRRNGFTLAYASKKLRGDRDVVLQAVQQTAAALQLASDELRKDKEIVLTAMKQAPVTLQDAHNELLGDAEFMLEAAKLSGHDALRCAGRQLREDKELVRAAVKQNGNALEFASGALQEDPDLLLLAVRRGGNALGTSRNFPLAAKDLLKKADFQEARDSAIAIKGEEAPIVSVTLSSSVGEVSGSEPTAAQATLRFDACLMSGKTFECILPVLQGSGPTANDLAKELVSELSKHSLATTVARVFINLATGCNDDDGDDDGDFFAVKPWDSERPLRDLMPGQRTGSARNSPQEKKLRT
eukprot:CAMPEP_0206606502 /NCGR_PEP_ID=MMETSP0325_2-20121206/51383_1 /ASSEMBLY_ACC=CAM_ASM_000347 /TAXON_ID=2866 /ORGANISM="Crypthecodinium cohnii, Strain Seligo" /LENGTH=413 /DNA_ID=CAMNT_0054122917 /DNA_START=72 /DNA_END=1313 /DNA_ORIENTATION=+